MQRELSANPPLAPLKGDVSVLRKLMNMRHTLRYQHQEDKNKTPF